VVDMKAKKGRFLVAYDYGMGGLWGAYCPQPDCPCARLRGASRVVALPRRC